MIDARSVFPIPTPFLPGEDEHLRLPLQRGEWDATIVIPTIGAPSVVVPAFRALRDNLPSDLRVRVVVVVNPKDAEDGAVTASIVERLGLNDGHRLDVLMFPGPVGFGGANNAGLAYANQTGGVGDLVVFYNDDLRATPGWLESLLEAIEAPFVQFPTEIPAGGKGPRPKRDRAAWGRVGLVGPVTTVAAGLQGVADAARVRQLGHAEYAREWYAKEGDTYVATEFLSGYCLGVTRECAHDILLPCPVAGYGVFDSPRYPVAGYEDNDICVRVAQAGYRALIDWRNYIGHVGHQSFDAAFPEMQRGMRNRAAYYRRFEAQTQKPDQRLVGVYRVRIGSVHELHLLKQSLNRHASILDGCAIVLTGHPLRDMAGYWDWPSRNALDEPERVLLKALEGTLRNVPDGDRWRWQDHDDVAELQKLFNAWAAGVLINGPGSRFKSDPLKHVKVEVWTGDFNEREERNAAIRLAYSMDPDWCISIDGDEIIEDRIRRGHFDRWMSHPDPLVGHYDFGWMDHWNDSQTYRTDGSWGDGGTYNGGRHGRRMWRVAPGPLRDRDVIFGGAAHGLHCGNVPNCSAPSVRTAGARWRHFGYVRRRDRLARFERYKALDPTPDPMLIGGDSYGHIVSEEGMRLEFYNAHNGIALHMLVHAGEDPGAVAGMLDALYSVVDHIVLVWTDEASPDAPPAEGGMPEELSYYARLFKADVLHAKLRDERGVNFAAVRNAAIEHIVTLNEQARLMLGWGLFVDPDEHYPNTLGVTAAIRRMAQACESYGWIFRFQNPTTTGATTMSDSVRMHRLEPDMRLRGRVHESFDAAIREIRKRTSPGMRVAPFIGINPGLADPAKIDGKIRRYAEGLIAELTDNPYNGGAWVSLGLQFEAEGRIAEAVQAYQLACRTLPESYIGYRAMLAHQLRVALAFALETQTRLSPSHQYYAVLERIVDFLREVGPPADNPATKRVLDDLALPPFPDINDGLTVQRQTDDLVAALAGAVSGAQKAVQKARGDAEAGSDPSADADAALPPAGAADAASAG